MRILSLLDHWSLNAPVHGVVRNSWCFVQLSLNVTRFCHHQPLDICHHHILNIWFHQQILTIYQNHFVIVTTMVATLQIIKGLLNMVHTTILNKNKLPSDAVLNWVFACSWCSGDDVSIICLLQVAPLILAFIDSSVKLGPYGEEIHCLVLIVSCCVWWWRCWYKVWWNETLVRQDLVRWDSGETGLVRRDQRWWDRLWWDETLVQIWLPYKFFCRLLLKSHFRHISLDRHLFCVVDVTDRLHQLRLKCLKVWSLHMNPHPSESIFTIPSELFGCYRNITGKWGEK